MRAIDMHTRQRQLVQVQIDDVWSDFQKIGDIVAVDASSFEGHPSQSVKVQFEEVIFIYICIKDSNLFAVRYVEMLE